MNELVKLSIVFALLMVIGYALARHVYLKKHSTFRNSDLEIKVLLWVPIFALFILFLFSGLIIQILLILWICIGIVLDLKDRIPYVNSRIKVIAFALTVIAGMSASIYLFNLNYSLLIAVVFSSVLSDVFAFFFGNYFGRHKLPKIINNTKSWEGVAGQIIGAFIGIALINLFVIDVPIWWFIIIGFGTALGDITNSYIKRSSGFKDWSKRIPGHGGYLDRFSSLGFALLLATIVSVMY